LLSELALSGDVSAIAQRAQTLSGGVRSVFLDVALFRVEGNGVKTASLAFVSCF